MNSANVVADIGTDPDALEAFYREHLDQIRRFVARRAHNPHDAADLTADVFLAAIRNCDGYNPALGTPSAWLYGIARNVVAGYYRSAGRAASAHDRFNARDLLDDDSTERLAARIDAEQDARNLLASFAGLSERERAVVELVAVDGLSLTEAASVLGISATTARVRYHRARRGLRQVALAVVAPTAPDDSDPPLHLSTANPTPEEQPATLQPVTRQPVTEVTP